MAALLVADIHNGGFSATRLMTGYATCAAGCACRCVCREAKAKQTRVACSAASTWRARRGLAAAAQQTSSGEQGHKLAYFRIWFFLCTMLRATLHASRRRASRPRTCQTSWMLQTVTLPGSEVVSCHRRLDGCRYFWVHALSPRAVITNCGEGGGWHAQTSGQVSSARLSSPQLPMRSALETGAPRLSNPLPFRPRPPGQRPARPPTRPSAHTGRWDWHSKHACAPHLVNPDHPHQSDTPP